MADLLPDVDNPMEMLLKDRARAAAAGDPHANFLCLATAAASGQPGARMVTIRELTDTHILVSANATGAKDAQLSENGQHELLLYWHSLHRQYRVRGAWERVAAMSLPALYAASPLRAKVWDWLYEELPQGTEVAEREAFASRFEQLCEELPQRHGSAEAVPPSPSAGYLRFTPEVVEAQAIDTVGRVHDRRRYRWVDGSWQCAWLVP